MTTKSDYEPNEYVDMSDSELVKLYEAEEKAKWDKNIPHDKEEAERCANMHVTCYKELKKSDKVVHLEFMIAERKRNDDDDDVPLQKLTVRKSKKRKVPEPTEVIDLTGDSADEEDRAVFTKDNILTQLVW